MSYTTSEISKILEDWNEGDGEALDKLIPLIFDDLRTIARRYFRHESPDHTLQPTALVGEVYKKLTKIHKVTWKNSAHFFGELAKMMRRILVDHARRRLAIKRGGGELVLSIDEALLPAQDRPADVVALDEALRTLKRLHPRQHEVVELKFFMGLKRQEIAEVLDVSLTTVIRDWANARAFLLHELKKTGGTLPG